MALKPRKPKAGEVINRLNASNRENCLVTGER